MMPRPRSLSFAMLALIFLGACSPQGDEDVSANVEKPEQATPGPRLLGTLPPFALSDQDGLVISRESLRDKMWIANFIFTRCGSTCPIQTQKLAALQATLKQSPAWEAIRFVSFTVDPAFDTAPVLQRYAQEYSADTDHWKFVTGSREALWSLCQDGFKLPVDENVEDDPAALIIHSAKLVLIDRQSRIRGYYDGLSEEGLQQVQADVNEILAEPHTPVTFKPLPYPSYVANPQWVKRRAQEQLAASAQYSVDHAFQFRDAVESSGVTFEHRSVDDARKLNIAAHYDHGNGVALADVDGDGLLDIYWTTQIGSNALWRNRGDGTFDDITTPALTLADRVCVGASFADTDNDGDADLFVTAVRRGNAFFENDGKGGFIDRSVEAGVNHQGHSSAGVFFDYDRDGLLDLFVCNTGQYTEASAFGPGGYHKAIEDAFAGHLKPERSERSLLYHNDGNNRFREVSEAMGLNDLSWTGEASPVDLNDDGWLDLYVLNMQGHDEAYVNLSGKGFEKQSRQWFPKTSWGSMSLKCFDYNNDGQLDLYITDMHSDMSHTIKLGQEKLKSQMRWPESLLQSGGMSIFGNSFFVRENGGYVEMSDKRNLECYWPWGVSVGDLNADGYQDAFVTCSMNYPYAYALNKVYLNDRGRGFLDSEFILGVEPRREGRTAKPIFTLEPDGVDKDHPMVEVLKLTEPVEIWGALGSRSAALADLDQDGDLDMVTNEFNDGPMILLSDLAEKRANLHWLKVSLRGKRSNRHGIGATVRVRVGDQWQTQVQDGQSGYLSQSLMPLYFGLAAAETLDEIIVTWPSGQSQTFSGPIKSNQRLEIEEL